MASFLLLAGVWAARRRPARKETRMRRVMSILVLGAATSLAALPAAAGSIEVRLGAFLPRAEGSGLVGSRATASLFSTTSDLFGTTKSDWRGFTGGLEFAGEIAPSLELGVHVDGYSRTLDTSYREFTRPGGREIEQTLELTYVPVGVTLRLIPGDRHAALRPYVGVGADLIFWNYEEFGDFIDFDSANLDIVADAFKADGVQPGFHVTGGLRLRLTDDLSLTGEARYQWAPREVMGHDFAPRAPGLENRLDFNGASFTAGLNLRF
jgi:opacity protein-like surface antigen